MFLVDGTPLFLLLKHSVGFSYALPYRLPCCWHGEHLDFHPNEYQQAIQLCDKCGACRAAHNVLISVVDSVPPLAVYTESNLKTRIDPRH